MNSAKTMTIAFGLAAACHCAASAAASDAELARKMVGAWAVQGDPATPATKYLADHKLVLVEALNADGSARTLVYKGKPCGHPLYLGYYKWRILRGALQSFQLSGKLEDTAPIASATGAEIRFWDEHHTVVWHAAGCMVS